MSAVYWFHNENQCEFSQPITVELQHCATSLQTSCLRFARCSDYSLPYNFEILQEGDFSPDEYGRIQLHNFSLIAVLKSLPLLTWIFGADDVKYYASAYYLWIGENLRKIHFVITKDLEAHATVCSSIFKSMFFLQCSSLLLLHNNNRQSQRSMMTKVPLLDHTYQLSLKQVASHWSYP